MKFPRTPRAARTRAAAAALVAPAVLCTQLAAATACARPAPPTSSQTAARQQQQQVSPQSSSQQSAPQQPGQGTAARSTPTGAVREFYRLLRERRFREAFSMSIYRPAVEGLSEADFEELRPEFEKLAADVPAQLDISGEQISGDQATVFVRNPYDPPGKFDEHPAILVGGAWVYGNRESQQAVNKEGRDYFFKARVETHHKEVEAVLIRIAEAEALYAASHGGQYAELPALLQESRLNFREEMRLAETLGYNFRVTLTDGGRGYRINAEPTKHGRTGRLSFSWQDGVLQKKDTGGKPYNPPAPKRKR